MARVLLQSIAHSYQRKPSRPQDYALRRLDHVWEDGGAHALLGPSGCGKTTLLNIVSGLVRPTEGRVLFNDTDVTDLPTKQRNIAQVFQFPVVYDTMTVFDNLAFPLRNRGVPPAQTRQRVHEVAELLDLSGELRKRAHGLGADAKQMISLGRGLVRSDVAAILFDEPLTVIDPHLKWVLRRKLKQIHQQLQLTLVYVTHDQNEALTFAEHVTVMSEGEVLQVGTPQELFERPAHTFVGHFIGSPGMNFLPLALDAGKATVDGQHIPLTSEAIAAASNAAGTLQIGVRPIFLHLGREPMEGAIPVAIKRAEDLGNYTNVTVALGEHALIVKVPEPRSVASERAFLRFDPKQTRIYADGRLIH